MLALLCSVSSNPCRCAPRFMIHDYVSISVLCVTCFVAKDRPDDNHTHHGSLYHLSTSIRHSSSFHLPSSFFLQLVTLW